MSCYEVWQCVRDSRIRFIVCRIALELATRQFHEWGYHVDRIKDELEPDPGFLKDVLVSSIALARWEAPTDTYNGSFRFPKTLEEFLEAFYENT